MATARAGQVEARLLRLLPLLQQVLTRVGVHRTGTGARLNLTDLQARALSAAGRLGSPTMSELAGELLVLQSAATRIGDDLVGKRLLERIEDGNDRRVTRVQVTAAGRRALEKVRGESLALLGLVMNRMSPEEQEALLMGLGSFVEAVRSAEREALLKCRRPECGPLRQAVKKEVRDETR